MEQQVTSLARQVETAVSTALGRVRPELDGADPLVRRSDRADFQSNVALASAKRLKARPAELAGQLVEALQDVDGIADVEVSGPGFLNITVADQGLWRQLDRRLADDRLGVERSEQGARVVIDYSAPNIAKEMHVGHLRTTIIGDSLARVLGHLGATVIRQNHLGDWGTQFGMLIQYIDEHPEARWRHSDLESGEVEPGASTVSALDGLYRVARAEFDADEAFADRSRARVVALQAGDEATLARWREIVDESEIAFRQIYGRLGVLLEPGDSAGESVYNQWLPEVVEELLAAGVAKHSDGAVVVESEEVKAPDGQPAVLMVQKRDGGYGYDTTDLATLRYRVRDLKADRILYVVDARQALHFRLIFEAARRMGWLARGNGHDSVEAVHVAFGTVLGPDGRPFKTRAGGTVRLMHLIDEAVDSARRTVAEREPDLSPAELDRIAEQAGVGAVKYADLSTSRVKDYTFDIARMVSLTGNTSVYLQYAHARIRSILRKAGDSTTAPDPAQVDSTLPMHPAERALVLALDEFGDVLRDVDAASEPHRLCTYLFETAKAFTDFYENCPVLSAEEGVRANRLALCRLAAATLHDGLGLLGIAAPDRM
ncbi:arginine--tRNA ligase [Pseudonocardia charpentierae]|uniref:Arginine--tRNA ligase n=1 Tax=Pseudonocardia charpentierae TaxID=3075545 RepID=A0ABU2N6P6_9PSEU|nr:arginine--tRNA ligase [Pseudonocardia sp. DSM 45834]MDT0349608.1 arginine--tRNA ligase [Pseudonocardia sp. DSM 45834]